MLQTQVKFLPALRSSDSNQTSSSSYKAVPEVDDLIEMERGSASQQWVYGLTIPDIEALSDTELSQIFNPISEAPIAIGKLLSRPFGDKVVGQLRKLMLKDWDFDVLMTYIKMHQNLPSLNRRTGNMEQNPDIPKFQKEDLILFSEPYVNNLKQILSNFK